MRRFFNEFPRSTMPPTWRLEALRHTVEKIRAIHDYKGAINILNRLNSASSTRLTSTTETATERTRKWLRILEIKDKQLQALACIHVAGTKGKGSVCLFTESILSAYQRQYGFPARIGCLTSPHMTDVRERIRLNGNNISKALFAHYVWTVWTVISTYTTSPAMTDVPSIPRYPGFLVLLAFYIFIHEAVDVAIIETGIGGETDSTNVITHPSATGITSLGLDHTDVLGNDITSIAWHKSGIFKRGSPAYTVPQEGPALQILQDRSIEKQVDGHLNVVDDQVLDRYGVRVYPDMPYQRQNASLAIALAERTMLKHNRTFKMTDSLARSMENTELPGRHDALIGPRNMWLISTAHNVLSMEQASIWFRETILQHQCKSVILLFNHESSRDVGPLLQALYRVLCVDKAIEFSSVIFCSNHSGVDDEKSDFIDQRQPSEPSLDAQERIGKRWTELTGHKDFVLRPTVDAAIRFIDGNYSGAVVVVTGTSYLAGKVKYIVARSDNNYHLNSR